MTGRGRPKGYRGRRPFGVRLTSPSSSSRFTRLPRVDDLFYSSRRRATRGEKQEKSGLERGQSSGPSRCHRSPPSLQHCARREASAAEHERARAPARRRETPRALEAESGNLHVAQGTGPAAAHSSADASAAAQPLVAQRGRLPPRRWLQQQRPRWPRQPVCSGSCDRPRQRRRGGCHLFPPLRSSFLQSVGPQAPTQCSRSATVAALSSSVCRPSQE